MATLVSPATTRRVRWLFAIAAFVLHSGCAESPRAEPRSAAASQLPPPRCTAKTKCAIKVSMKDDRIVHDGVIRFETNSAKLIGDDTASTLSSIRDFLADTPNVRIIVRGHTDNQGDKWFNIDLSQQRAEAVRRSLVSAGIDANRVTARGYGALEPIATNDTEEGRAMNRRVEFVVVSR